MLISSKCATVYPFDPGDGRIEGDATFIDTIVLHDMNGFGYSAYLNEIDDNLPYPYTGYYYNKPAYLNIVVSGNNFTELAPYGMTVRGVDAYSSNSHSPTSSPSTTNDGLFHIGVWGNGEALGVLLCCLVRQYPTLVNIVGSDAVDYRRNGYPVSSSLIAYVDGCRDTEAPTGCECGGCGCYRCEDFERVDPETLPCTCEDEIAEAIQIVLDTVNEQYGNHEHGISDEAAALIAALTGRVVILESQIVDAQNDITSLTAALSNLTTSVSNIIMDLNECCGESSLRCLTEPLPLPACVDAFIYPEHSIEVAGGIETWLEFAGIVHGDQFVTPGPLWTAGISGSECTVDVDLAWDAQTWCDDAEASIYAIACSDRYLLATSPAGGSLSGSAVISVPEGCEGIHIEVYHNDDKPHNILSANIKICCSDV